MWPTIPAYGQLNGLNLYVQTNLGCFSINLYLSDVPRQHYFVSTRLAKGVLQISKMCNTETKIIPLWKGIFIPNKFNIFSLHWNREKSQAWNKNYFSNEIIGNFSSLATFPHGCNTFWGPTTYYVASKTLLYWAVLYTGSPCFEWKVLTYLL